MKKSLYLSLCPLLAIFVFSSSQLMAHDETETAEEDKPYSIEANVSLVSDYVFRGFTQTDNKPAIQGGFDFSHESGFYLGIWGSNVDFGDDDAQVELDYYGGFAFDVGPVNIDLGFIYYDYPGEQDFDFYEIYAALGYSYFTLSAYYSDQFLGGDNDIESLYVNLEFAYTLPYDIGLTLAAGHQSADEGFDDYWDYKVALSKEWFGVEWGIAYTDVSAIEGGLDDSETFIASISKSF